MTGDIPIGLMMGTLLLSDHTAAVVVGKVSEGLLLSLIGGVLWPASGRLGVR